jgi:hypothetical protein
VCEWEGRRTCCGVDGIRESGPIFIGPPHAAAHGSKTH